MWSSIANKQAGFDSVQFTKDDKKVFKIDGSEPEIVNIWQSHQGDYHQSLFHVIAWFIRNRLVK